MPSLLLDHPLAIAGAFALAAPGLLACSKEPRLESRPVVVHAPAECPVGADAFAVFYAYGDFNPSPERPPQERRRLNEVGAVLADLPAETRALVVDIAEEDRRWWALGEVPARGGVDVLAWPYRAPCRLTDEVGASPDGSLAAVSARHVLAVDRADVFVADLATGIVSKTATPLRKPRLGASVTAFGDGALIAGGQRPDGSEVTDTAEIVGIPLDGTRADVTRDVLVLGRGRAYHGAAVLANGDTVLVGGIGADGRVLDSIEILDGRTGEARPSPATLRVPRRNPTVLRLASGKLLVAGGVDGAGQPVRQLEWFSADATSGPLTVVDLEVAAPRQAFVPLPAGGALAVVAPDPPVADRVIAHVIRDDYTVQHAPPTDPRDYPTTVALFSGGSGAPVLWNGARWLRWHPWLGTFEPLADVPDGAGGPAEGEAFVSPDPGLAIWRSAGRIAGLRFGVRGPYATDPVTRPLLLYDTAFTAPDRLPESANDPMLRFDPATGLSLGDGAAVFVTDARFAALDLDFQVMAGPLPRVLLRDDSGNELDVTSSCALAAAAPTVVHVERRDDTVRASVSGGPLATCASTVEPLARLSVGVRGPSAGVSVIRALTVVRR